VDIQHGQYGQYGGLRKQYGQEAELEDQRSKIKDVFDARAPSLACSWRGVQYDLFDLWGALGI